MNLLISIAAAIVTLILGFAGGVQFEKMRHAAQDIEQLLQSEQSEQRYATVVSLAALDTLEAGQLDKTKSLLARSSRYIITRFTSVRHRFLSNKGWHRRLMRSLSSQRL